jgi:hypothetical protein
MPRTKTLDQHFHGPGVRAYLSCDTERCTFDIGIARSAAESLARLRVRVIWQPRGARGLASGPPVCWCDETVRLCDLGNERWRWACLHLPRTIGPAVARDCYYVVQPERSAV